MASAEVPSVRVEPSDAMMSLFRRTVMTAYGRDPLDKTVTVSIDRFGYSANLETIVSGSTAGQRFALDRCITLSTDGELAVNQESETLNQRLAREIKGLDPEPSAFDRDVVGFRSVGFSTEEAYDMAVDMLFMRPGIARACNMLVGYFDRMADEAAHGLHDVDAFELADAIQSVRDNFRLPPL